MDELVELALRAFHAARAWLAARPVLALAVAGLVCSVVVMVAGARVGAAPSAVPYDLWLGLSPRPGYGGNHRIAAVVLVAATAGLVALWLLALAGLRRWERSLGSIWFLGGVWAAPFLVGPPLFSTDVFGSVSDGLLLRDGLSPYHHAATALGARRVVEAIDPGDRSVRSASGPMSLLLHHLVVSVGTGNVVAAVLLLRAVAAVAVVVCGILALELAGSQRPFVLGLIVLNPAVLLYIVGACHLDSLTVALVLGALVLARRGRWPAAVAVATVAAGFEQIAFVAVLALVAVHAFGSVRPSWRRFARDVLVVAVVLVLATLAVPHGTDWRLNLDRLTHDHTPFAPACLLSDVVSWIVPAASFDDLAVGGRVAALAAAVTAIGYLLITVRRRPIERTVGYALLAGGLLAPVLYPWFLLWGVLVLAATARDAVRDCIVALSVAGCFLQSPDLPTWLTDATAAVALVLCGAVVVVRAVVRERQATDDPQPQPVSAGG